MSAAPVPSVEDTELEPLPRLAWRPLLLIAGVLVVVAVLLAERYGYHRDELYFVAAGKRLAWGYVDQPPFTPAIAHLSDVLFGDSLRGFRFFAAIPVALSVVLTGAAARELGGKRWAQVLAAGAAALTPLFHTPAFMVSTATFDFAFWAAIFVLVLRLLRTNDDRLWIPIGVIAGIGLLNKHTIVFLGVSLAIGFLATPRRTLLLRPTAALGVAIAIAIWLPNLWWQHQHEWPVFEMSEALNARNGGLLNLILFIPAELALTGVLSVFIWGWGLWWLLRAEEAKRWRPLGIMPVALFAVFVVVGGKPYYLAPVFVVLFAAGAVVVAEQDARIRRIAVACAVVSGIVSAPPSLPLIPNRYLDTVIGMNAEFGEMHGWPSLANQVAEVYHGLSPQERVDTVILTQNYGEHGAMERYGPARGLPRAYSGHNNIWLWGYPPDTATTVVAIGIAPNRLDTWFRSCEVVHAITNPANIDNEENGEPISVCRAPRRPWSQIWPELRHYD